MRMNGRATVAGLLVTCAAAACGCGSISGMRAGAGGDAADAGDAGARPAENRGGAAASGEPAVGGGAAGGCGAAIGGGTAGGCGAAIGGGAAPGGASGGGSGGAGGASGQAQNPPSVEGGAAGAYRVPDGGPTATARGGSAGTSEPRGTLGAGGGGGAGQTVGAGGAAATSAGGSATGGAGPGLPPQGADAAAGTTNPPTVPPVASRPMEGLVLYRPGTGAVYTVSSRGDGTFAATYAVGDNGSLEPNGVAGYDLLSDRDRVLTFDYDGDGRKDLFLYRPGSGAAYVAHANSDGSFVAAYAVGDNGSTAPNGIADYDLLSTADRVLSFDYNGDGKQDLFLYRPGAGAAYVARSNGDGTFTAVYAVGDNGSAAPNGIAGYDLLAPSDIALPFDYDGDGKSDLLLYRPGTGAVFVAHSNGDGTFTATHAVGDNGSAEPNGIAGYDLLSPNDRVLAFDYDGDRKQDLLLYRPGTGAVFVAHSNGDGTFSATHAVGDNGSAAPNGIAGYDLLSPSDRVLAFDYDGDGKQDLFLYRPGTGAAFVARSNGDGSFTAVYAVGDNGATEPNGIAGYDLLSPNDQVLSFDYDGNGKQDLFLYRPGTGAAFVARSNGDGSFTAVYAIGDNGATEPNGIAGYDLLSPSDLVVTW